MGTVLFVFQISRILPAPMFFYQGFSLQKNLPEITEFPNLWHYRLNKNMNKSLNKANGKWYKGKK